MEKFLEMIQGLNSASVCIRLLLAMMLGGILGFEREQYNRAAGFRTFIVVCVGATLATMTGIFMFKEGFSTEASRMPAQIISGMGFLGAGTILVTRKSRVKGLTTAAGLWTVACIGIAVGSGFYSGAVLGTIMIMLVLEVLKVLEPNIKRKTEEYQIYVETSNPTIVRHIIKIAREMSVSASDYELATVNDGGEKQIAVIFTAKFNNSKPDEFVESINKIENVKYVEIM